MNADEALELARKTYPNDENLRVAYMLGLDAGANWQAEQDEKEQADLFTIVALDAAQRAREQMMKGAISCNVIWHDGPLLDYTQEQQDNALEKIGATIGDKVRIIIVKEDSHE